jgi:hypothetical protein
MAFRDQHRHLAGSPSTVSGHAFRPVARLSARRTRTPLNGFTFMFIHTGKVRVVWRRARVLSLHRRRLFDLTRTKL